MGNLSSTYANDFLIIDGTETITYAVGPSFATHFTVVGADPRDYTAREIAGAGGNFVAGDRQWSIGANQFSGGLKPKRGDKITETDGTVWYLIDNATQDGLRLAWLCPTRLGA